MSVLRLLVFASALGFLSHTAAAQTTGATGQVAEINGAQISYEVSGQGQPMVLIHGYPLSKEIFNEQVASLSDRYQVITLDLRGFGDSTAPDNRGSIQRYARDVLALMGQQGLGQAIIGGHSMGGIITLEMYRQAFLRHAVA